MPQDIFEKYNNELLQNNKALEISLLISKLKNGLWIFGIPSWLFGITDRSFASFADGYLSTVEFLQLFTASFFFVSWLYLKPEKDLYSENAETINIYRPPINYSQHEVYICTAKTRMIELQEQHMISQEYFLPFPYFCQIYHLLNLKHLETIHNFSLSNLKVISVSELRGTDIGGSIRFQTILDSPVNALRIWRQPIVDVILILHTPYTVELSIPVYNNKTITVIFNAIPLSHTAHKLYIDIYSNLDWPKPLLQVLLHFSSCLTLFEDLPYLRQLAQRNIYRLMKVSRASKQETMWLFRRFVDLYGSSIEASRPMKALDVAADIDDNFSV